MGKTEHQIVTDRNIKGIHATLEAQNQLIGQLQREVKDLKDGMVAMTNANNAFKNQVQVMIAKTYGSGPSDRSRL